jgi:hypothetical protein
MNVKLSGTAKTQVHPRWTKRRFTAIMARVEKFTGKTLPSWATLIVKKQRRGYGQYGGNASVPTRVLAPDIEELYGVYYIVHELLHVLHFGHGVLMQNAERKIMASFGGRLCYGPADPNYPVAIKDKDGNIVCGPHGKKLAATWFYEI